MQININDIIIKAKEEGEDITPSDIGANLMFLFLDNQKLSHILTNYKDNDDPFFNELSASQSATRFYNKPKSKYLQTTLKPIAIQALENFKAEYLNRQDLKKTLQEGNELQYKGLTANKIRAILETLVSRGIDSNDTKEVLDTLKLYVSKFDLGEEDKAKHKLINIEHKETKICRKCGSEIA